MQSLDYYCRCRRRREPLCAHINLVGARRRVCCTQAAVCAHADAGEERERELKRNHYGNALRNENSRAHCISYCISPAGRHSFNAYTCRICALIYTQANKSRMNFFLITRDIKERARLERSLNYYRSTAAFASRCAAGNPLQPVHFSRITLSLSAQQTHTEADVKMFQIERVEENSKKWEEVLLLFIWWVNIDTSDTRVFYEVICGILRLSHYCS